MRTIRLGRTDLTVSKVGFGALPIQRVSFEQAGALLRRAVEAGVNFIDTARGYSDSEQKIARALGDLRDRILLATKVAARDKAGTLDLIDASLRDLATDHVDILQLHNPKPPPDPDDPDSAYAALLDAREAGRTRFIGLTTHSLDAAVDAARAGLYDTIQFPLSAISAPRDLALIDVCREHDVGVIAMKALCGGLLTNARVALAFFEQYDNVVPIYGVQRMAELDEFLALEADPPTVDDAMRAEIASLQAELADDFCRGCGYCLPCPAEIPIPMAARMSLLMRRLPTERFLTPHWQQQMRRINDCQDCGQCRERCPYGLDPPAMLTKMLADYEAVLRVGHV